VAVLLPDGAQAAAVPHPRRRGARVVQYVPFSGAAVLSRGIVGDRDGAPVVMSPIYKQAFDLRTAGASTTKRCSVPVFSARVRDGMALVGSP